MARKFKREADRARLTGGSSALQVLEWDEGGPSQAWVVVEITHRRAEALRKRSLPLHAPSRVNIEHGDPSKV